MVSSVTNSSNASNVSGTGNSAGQTSAAAAQDRFLKLLVAQLANQDPMNPTDNAQMTSQMAQINTVSGIQQLNDTMQSISSQFAAMQTLQGTSMIGHDVYLASNTLSIDAGVAKGAVNLSAAADSVKLNILSPGGSTVETVDLGAMTAGRHEFTWNASKYTGTGNPTFKIVATQGGVNVSNTALARDTITSVGTAATGNNLQLKGRSAVSYDAIQAYL